MATGVRGSKGYCSAQSVEAGDTLEIMVSTDPARKFILEIFRTGYYGGKGASLKVTLGPFQGKKQLTPQPGPKNIHECTMGGDHHHPDPGDWLSGVYLGRLSTLPDKGG
jgi:hypothetical protein